ncbi:TPA: lipopolysaccharide biosynthesis protein [Vibrio metoecus]
MIASLLKYAPVQVFSALCVFVLFAVQTRFLSPENYGVLAVVMVVLELVRAFSTQWLNTSMLRLYPTYSAQEQEQLVQSISLLTIMGSLLGFVVIIVSLLIYHQLSCELLLILCALLFVKSIFQYQLELSRLNERLRTYRQAALLQAIFSVVFSMLWLSWSATLESALFALTLSFCIGTLALGLPEQPKWHIAMLRLLLTYGIPIMLAGGVSVLSGRVDRLYIAHFIGMNETGIYAAQINLLMSVMSMVFMIIALPLYPNLTKCAEERSVLFYQHKIYLHLLLAITLPVFFALGMIQNEIILLFLGEQYTSNRQEYFWILVVAIYLINIKAHYLDHGLQFSLQTSKLVWLALLGLVLSLILLPILLPKFGAFGAAVSLLITSAVVAGFSFISSWRIGYRYSIGIDGIKVFIASLIMCGWLYTIRMILLPVNPLLGLMLYILSSVIVYGGCLIIFNAFQIRERLKLFWRLH